MLPLGLVQNSKKSCLFNLRLIPMNIIPRETKDNRVVEKDAETKFYLCHISTFSLAVTTHSDIMMLGTNVYDFESSERN